MHPFIMMPIRTLTLIFLIFCAQSLFSQNVRVYTKANNSDKDEHRDDFPVFLNELTSTKSNGIYITTQKENLKTLNINYDSIHIAVKIPDEFKFSISKIDIEVYLNLSNISNCSWLHICCINTKGRGIFIGDKGNCLNRHYISITN